LCQPRVCKSFFSFIFQIVVLFFPFIAIARYVPLGEIAILFSRGLFSGKEILNPPKSLKSLASYILKVFNLSIIPTFPSIYLTKLTGFLILRLSLHPKSLLL